jgi:YHS domain-containing protein
MLSRFLAHWSLVVALVILLRVSGIALMAQSPTSDTADAHIIKKALQELQPLIGEWHLEASRKVGGKVEAWKESVFWSWQFPASGPCLYVEFAGKQGKYFTHGHVHYDVAMKQYRLSLHTSDNKELTLLGRVVRGTLKAESRDAVGDVHRISMLTLADGVRFQLRYDRQEGGKGLFLNVLAYGGNRAGESFAAVKKKPECIVSGGAATIPVTYQGKQYFVCCTGCRDEFYANPEKYIAAAAKK